MNNAVRILLLIGGLLGAVSAANARDYDAAQMRLANDMGNAAAFALLCPRLELQSLDQIEAMLERNSLDFEKDYWEDTAFFRKVTEQTKVMEGILRLSGGSAEQLESDACSAGMQLYGPDGTLLRGYFSGVAAVKSDPGPGITDPDTAVNLGTLLAGERYCGLSFQPGAIEALISRKVAADDMSFARDLRLFTRVARDEHAQMSDAEKNAHCRQLRRVAKTFGLAD